MQIRMIHHCHCFFAAACMLILALGSEAYAFSDPAFENSVDKGNFGESITEEMMRSRGYESLPAKYQGNNGIDHVFAKRGADSQPREVVIVETKTDSSPYNPRQLSNFRLQELSKRMRASSDPAVRKTASIIGDCSVRKEYWRHDTSTGRTTVHGVAEDGTPTEIKAHFNTVRIQNQLHARRGATPTDGRRQTAVRSNRTMLNQPSTARASHSLPRQVMPAARPLIRLTLL